MGFRWDGPNAPRSLALAEQREELIARIAREEGWEEAKARKYIELAANQCWTLSEMWAKAPMIPLDERQARVKKRRGQ